MLHDFLRSIYRRMRAKGNSYGVRRARIDAIFPTVLQQKQFGKESAIFEFIDENFFQFDIQLLEDGVNQIVRQRSGRLDIFHYDSNGLGFRSANNDRQTSYSVFFCKDKGVSACLNLTERNPENGQFYFLGHFFYISN